MPWDRKDRNEWGRVPEGERQFMSLAAMLTIVSIAVVGCGACFGFGLDEVLNQILSK